MNRLEEFNLFAETQTYKDILIGKSSSIVDTVKEINQVLNEDQEEYYRVPQDRELIARNYCCLKTAGPTTWRTWWTLPSPNLGSPLSQPGSMPTSSLDCSNN